MPDRVLMPLMGLAAVLMIALALVWPQGVGARSPGLFGHTPVQQTAAAKAARARAQGAATPAVLSMAPVLTAPQPGAAR
jgi:hypothetical protein